MVFDVKPTWDETSLKNFSSFLLPMLVIKTLIPTYDLRKFTQKQQQKKTDIYGCISYFGTQWKIEN